MNRTTRAFVTGLCVVLASVLVCHCSSGAQEPESKEAKTSFPLPANPDSQPEAVQNQTTGAIEILEVIEGSQAWLLGLQTGDFILEYDGLKLTRASELVEVTKKTAPHETVEMIISRDETPLKYFVNGGFIGVRIKTVLVMKDWVDY